MLNTKCQGKTGQVYLLRDTSILKMGQAVYSKPLVIFNKLHKVTSQKTVILIPL
jgi:hypothetical protein